MAFDYDNWKCNFHCRTQNPLPSSIAATMIATGYLDLGDVRAFENLQEVCVIKTGRTGDIVDCQLQDNGKRLWCVRFVYDPNGDNDECDWFAESELRAV